MAACTILNSELTTRAGQRGKRELRGVATWNSTDATGTLAVNGFARIDNVQITPAQTPASDEIQYWNDTLVSGALSPASALAPVINLGRTGAARTSGMAFCFLITGR